MSDLVGCKPLKDVYPSASVYIISPNHMKPVQATLKATSKLRSLIILAGVEMSAKMLIVMGKRVALVEKKKYLPPCSIS